MEGCSNCVRQDREEKMGCTVRGRKKRQGELRWKTRGEGKTSGAVAVGLDEKHKWSQFSSSATQSLYSCDA